MRNRPDQFSILDHRAARHALHNPPCDAEQLFIVNFDDKALLCRRVLGRYLDDLAGIFLYPAIIQRTEQRRIPYFHFLSFGSRDCALIELILNLCSCIAI